jgi:hypothetical protein
VDEARRQARHVLDDARGQLQEQAGSQQDRLAGGLRTFSDQLERLASGEATPDESGVAVDLAREVASRVAGAASWLEGRNTSEILDDVRSFARRRPGTFILVAAGAGLVVGRLARSLKDAPSQPQSSYRGGNGATTLAATAPTYSSGATVPTTGSTWSSTTDLPTSVGSTGVTSGYGAGVGTGYASEAGTGYESTSDYAEGATSTGVGARAGGTSVGSTDGAGLGDGGTAAASGSVLPEGAGDPFSGGEDAEDRP